MFPVLNQMKRLADQVCERFGLEVGAITDQTEGLVPRKIYPDGSVEYFHNPYYKVLLKVPNAQKWRSLICIPHRGAYMEFSASQNNVTVIVRDYDGVPHVIPSWRGKLVPLNELSKEPYLYYIKKGYMLIEPPPEYLIKQAMRVSVI